MSYIYRIKLYKAFRFDQYDDQRATWHVFGYYDTLSVEKLLIPSGSHMLEAIYKDSQSESNSNGMGKKHVIYALGEKTCFNCEDSCDCNFCGDNKKENSGVCSRYPLLQISLIHFRHPLPSSDRNTYFKDYRFVNNIEQLKMAIERYLAEKNLDIRFNLCVSLDCNDVIIFWHGNAFQNMMDTLSEICERQDNIIGEVFTIQACYASFLSDSVEEKYRSLRDQWIREEPIFNRLQIYLRGNEHGVLFASCQRLEKQLTNEWEARYPSIEKRPTVSTHVMPGQEDVLLDFYGLPINDFFRFYYMREDGRSLNVSTRQKKLKEIKPESFCSERLSRTVILSCLPTHIDTLIDDLSDDQKYGSEGQVSAKSQNVQQRRPENCDTDGIDVIGLIKLLNDTVEKKKVIPPIWYSALMELLVELSNIEVSTTAYDIYVQAMPSQRRLVMMLVQLFSSKDPEVKKELFSAQSGFTKQMVDYLNGWSQLSFHAMHAEWKLTQTSDINRLYIFPAKLSRLYCAFIEKSSQLLNIGAAHEPCSFFLTPNVSNEATFDSVFGQMDRPEVLIHGEIPAHFMFLPQVLLPILIHEAAHYAGQKLRNREYRYECIMRCMMAHILCKVIKSEYHQLEDRQGNLVFDHIVDDLYALTPPPPDNEKKYYYSKYVYGHIVQKTLNVLQSCSDDLPSDKMTGVQMSPVIPMLLCRYLVSVNQYCHLDHIQRALAVTSMLEPKSESVKLVSINWSGNIRDYCKLLLQIYAESFSDMCMIKVLNLNEAEYLYVIYCGNRYHNPLNKEDRASLREQARYDRYLSVLKTAHKNQSSSVNELLSKANIDERLKESFIPANEHTAVHALAMEMCGIQEEFQEVPLARVYARQFLCDYLRKVSEALRLTIGKEDVGYLNKKLRNVYKALAKWSCSQESDNLVILKECLSTCAAIMDSNLEANGTKDGDFNE